MNNRILCFRGTGKRESRQNQNLGSAAFAKTAKNPRLNEQYPVQGQMLVSFFIPKNCKSYLPRLPSARGKLEFLDGLPQKGYSAFQWKRQKNPKDHFYEPFSFLEGFFGRMGYAPVFPVLPGGGYRPFFY